jgi:G:T-mismatch repair DNA endonuclease (very short patch repair protein)
MVERRRIDWRVVIVWELEILEKTLQTLSGLVA